MSIKSIGGEFALIKKISDISNTCHKNLAQGIGDDAAVIQSSTNEFTLVTTDILVEKTHFKTQWSSPQQIGIKAVECNVSDIAAMGGHPTFMFVSLVLPFYTDVTWVEELYKGMNTSCTNYGIVLAGGDTTQGKLCIISVTLLGTVSPDNLCLRSHAKPGDLLAVTGNLGSSSAGLKILSSGHAPSDYLRHKHLIPKSRLLESIRINSIVNAMIDISDGLSSEIRHLCSNSKTGAEIYEAELPIHEEVRAVAKHSKQQASDFALMGGEDLELLFSFNPTQTQLLDNAKVNYYVIGKVTEPHKGITMVTESGIRKALTSGYDHFM